MSQVEIRTALELAFQAIPAVIPTATITTSAGSVFTTSSPHNLPTGVDVKVTNHTTLTFGKGIVEVLSATTFRLKNKITGQVVTVPSGSGGTVTAQLIAWENISFDPLNGVPYEKINFIFSAPENPTMGGSFYRERGYMQVTLCFPQKTGSLAAMSRAELIRQTYPRGASFSNNGIVTHIDRTPEILVVGATDENYIVFVRVRFYADIYS